MYPSVKWPVRGSQRVLLVPPSSIVTTSERMFVVRVNDGNAEWVDIKRGPTQGDGTARGRERWISGEPAEATQLLQV